REAKRENISIERKLAQLTVHGFLHLQGYDHELSENSARKMFKLERKILSKIRCF
ncbi:MAG: rRNA maturation RNase YbeY, partial [Candidatus Yanofskybacteria bacterium]|nr:rRNA maturation RNase YbeY [Candidatus Yanofskybacteria bacterium]